MSERPSLETLNVQRLTDAVYRTLKERIMTQIFAPGQRLHVDELADQLGVSRTPVKDALNALSREGLVEIIPRRGTFVAGLSAEGIADVFELRRALELLAAELLVEKVTEDDLAQLHASLSDLEASMANEGNVDEHMRRNLAFHRLLIQFAGNHRLLELYEGLNVHIQIARVHARWSNWWRRRQQEHAEHLAILKALEARDWPQLAAAVNAHIRRAKQSLVKDLKTSSVITHRDEGVGRHRRTPVRVSHTR